MESEDIVEEKQKVRRYTVQVCSLDAQEINCRPSVPPKGGSEEVLENSNVPSFRMKPAIVVSYYGPSNGLFTSTPPISQGGSGKHLHDPSRTNFHVQLRRRASDGNAVTLVFHIY